MDFNRYSYYRANPFAHNDYIPAHSMANRSQKLCVSQIPQGEQHYPLRSGKRIFKDKVYMDEIDKQKILQSPQRYPFQNRIALDKKYSRNLDTIDIEGASSGTLISQSVRNRKKALEQLKKKKLDNNLETQLQLENNLDGVYEQKRRQLAQRIVDEKQGKLSRINYEINKIKNTNTQIQSEIQSHPINNSISKQNNLSPQNQRKFLEEYQRYIDLNSSQKYSPQIPNSHQYEGFQRYKKSSESQLSSNRLGQQQGRYHSIDRNSQMSQINTDQYSQLNPSKLSPSILDNDSRAKQYLNNHTININNRHRSNPEYIDNYAGELYKRIEEKQKDQIIDENIKNVYELNKKQFRKNNPTHLSFNIAARSMLMSPVI